MDEGQPRIDGTFEIAGDAARHNLRGYAKIKRAERGRITEPTVATGRLAIRCGAALSRSGRRTNRSRWARRGLVRKETVARALEVLRSTSGIRREVTKEPGTTPTTTGWQRGRLNAEQYL